MYHVSLSLSRACVFALALGSATASCTFNPSGQVGGPDGSTEPRPDADPARPDANPGAPDARPADARVDAPDAMVPPEACEAWTPRPTHFDPCDLPPPSAALNLSEAETYVYDTDAVTLKDAAGNELAHASRELPGNPPVRAISVESLLVGNVARLRVVGSKPLLVASWSEITVEGTIDVSSALSGSGAGANTGDCTPSGAGGMGNSGGGGGGGGGFGGNGGSGGTGQGGANAGNPGGVVPQPGAVRGGCPGAGGGRGDRAAGGGAGGAGGGALQLTAQARISILGRLHAGGSGGAAARGSSDSDSPTGRRNGGGGGGSGGLIDLEAPSIAFGPSSVVAANGGGGGEGSGDEDGDPGFTGRIDDVPAAGGSGGSNTGGDGGDGSAGADRDGETGRTGTQDGGDRGGGGGGGGGAGYIIIDGIENVGGGAVLSPAPVDR